MTLMAHLAFYRNTIGVSEEQLKEFTASFKLVYINMIYHLCELIIILLQTF